MSQHILVTPVTGSIPLGKLSLPISSISEIFTVFPSNSTSIRYVDASQNVISLLIAESAATLANRINAITS